MSAFSLSIFLLLALIYYYYKFEINSKLNKGISCDSCEHHSNEEAELHQQNFNDEFQMDTISCSMLRKCQVLNVQCWMLNAQVDGLIVTEWTIEHLTSWNSNQKITFQSLPLFSIFFEWHLSNAEAKDCWKIFRIEKWKKKSKFERFQ